MNPNLNLDSTDYGCEIRLMPLSAVFFSVFSAHLINNAIIAHPVWLLMGNSLMEETDFFKDLKLHLQHKVIVTSYWIYSGNLGKSVSECTFYVFTLYFTLYLYSGSRRKALKFLQWRKPLSQFCTCGEKPSPFFGACGEKSSIFSKALNFL